MKKITKFTKSYFNGSARKFLCLGLCVMLVVFAMGSLTPVVSPAFGEVVYGDHRYQLYNTHSLSPTPPYGFVNVYQFSSEEGLSGYTALIKFANDPANPSKPLFWGRVGRGASGPTNTRVYDWDDDTRSLVEVTDGYITAKYDETNQVNERKTALDESVTLYKDCFSSNDRGGALYVNDSSNKKIKADFVGNGLQVESAGGPTILGGAIYFYESTVGDVEGDFISNYVDVKAASPSAYGGAISIVAAQIGNLKGDFIANHINVESTSTDGMLSGEGGAIRNYGQIESITGDFLANYICQTGEQAEFSLLQGGAIYNFSSGEIGDIAGNFVGNYLQSQTATVNGGAIYSAYATLGNITGDFIGNYVQSTTSSGSGGAIHNESSVVGNITGNFIGNYVVSGSFASGGAINFQGVSGGVVKGNFIGNYVQVTGEMYCSANGGAICNTVGGDSKVEITGDFIGNYAQAAGEGSRAYGGAINNSGKINIVTKDKDILFSGNYVSAQDPANALGGAIRNGGTLTLNAAGHSITFVGDAANDKVDSVYNRGKLYITGDGDVKFAEITNDADEYGVGIVIGNMAGGSFTNYGAWLPFDTATQTSTNTVDVTFGRENEELPGTFFGYIDMNDIDWDGHSARSFRQLTINGDTARNNTFTANGGTFVINTNLAKGEGDLITLNHANVSGTAYVKVAYDPFYATAVNGQRITGDHTFLKVTNGSIKILPQKTAYDKGNGYTVIITPTVKGDSDGTEWKITALTAGEYIPDPVVVEGEMVKAVSDTSNAINMAWMNNVNNLQKRLGDLRGGAASNTGWARFQRNNDDLKTGRQLNVSGNLYQLGYDVALKGDSASRGYFGLSVEHFDGTHSYKIGSGDLKSTSLAAYYTKIYDSGHYFDLIFRYGRYNSDTTNLDTTVENPILTKLDYAVNGVTLSGEYGYRWNFGKDGFYLEPQAELIYGHLGGAKKLSSASILADVDSTNHFITRCGVALGQRVKNFNYYLRGSYYHDFAGATNVRYGDASYKQDSAQNWWEVSLGGGWNMSNTSYFYAELTKHFKDVSNSVNFNLGFRFTL
ncbi:MAG: autotransporter outer membrane beta-barrel domain-containing protein [Synergistaceae bacterium]|nr:autotransporter outer membrane beta-barrel domain-containing protein [Synergistaceae bacterium]